MNDWQTTTLGEIVDVLDSRRRPVNSDERRARLGEVPYYGANGQQGWIDKPLFDEPLILLAEDGGNFDDFAIRPIAYRITGKSWVNNHAHIIRAANGIDQSFLFWSLVHRDIRRFISGGTRTKLTQAEMRSIELEIPSFPEQCRISEILDTLDDQIRATEKIIDKLKVAKQALLKDLLTYGIDENYVRRDPSCRPDQFEASRLGLLPKGWRILSIAEVCSLIVDCPHSTPNFLDSGIFVARTSNIRNGDFLANSASYVSEAEYSERISRAEPNPGDLILTREAPVGEAFIIPQGMRICLGQRVMLLRPRVDMLAPQYLLAQLYSGRVRERIDVLTAGTTNPHINVAEVKRFELPVPGIDEQIRISEALQAHDTRARTESRRLDKLGKLKAGLMSDLLTGTVRAPEDWAS